MPKKGSVTQVPGVTQDAPKAGRKRARTEALEVAPEISPKKQCHRWTDEDRMKMLLSIIDVMGIKASEEVWRSVADRLGCTSWNGCRFEYSKLMRKYIADSESNKSPLTSNTSQSSSLVPHPSADEKNST